MATGPTQEQLVHRRVVLRGTVQRSHHEGLVNRKLAVMPVTSYRVEFAFHILRRQEFMIDKQ